MVSAAKAEQRECGDVVVTTEEWPIAVIRMPRLVELEAGLAFGRAVDELTAREKAFALLIDHRATAHMDAAARKAIADWEKSRSASLKTFCKALAIVMPNRAMFAVVTLISWLNPPPYPKRCFLPAEWPRARAWALEHLRDASRSGLRPRT